MKAGIILCIAYALLISTDCSQSKKIVMGYAYARNIIAGVKPGVSIDENGTITAKHKPPGIQYFIYIETKDTAHLHIKSIWIKGVNYLANAEMVKNIPLAIAKDSFILNRNNPDSNKFVTWQINVAEIISSSDKGFKQPSQLKDNEVLVSFLHKNKIQYFPIAKLYYLPPVNLQ